MFKDIRVSHFQIYIYTSIDYLLFENDIFNMLTWKKREEEEEQKVEEPA